MTAPQMDANQKKYFSLQYTPISLVLLRAAVNVKH